MLSVLKKLNFPCEITVDTEKIIEAMRHDKKMSGDFINAVFVDEIGSFNIKQLPFREFCEEIKAVY